MAKFDEKNLKKHWKDKERNPVVSDASGTQRIIWSLILIVAGCSLGCTLGHDAGRVKEVATFTINLSKIPNGKYRGDHRAEKIDYEVEVSVVSHQIVEIKIVKGMQRVFQKKCALCEVNDLIWEIIDLQSIDVDALTGATQTRMAIVHAISDALTPPYSRD